MNSAHLSVVVRAAAAVASIATSIAQLSVSVSASKPQRSQLLAAPPESDMDQRPSLSNTLTGLLAAGTATVAILGAVVALFQSASVTPQVPSDYSSVADCTAAQTTSAQHDCPGVPHSTNKEREHLDSMKGLWSVSQGSPGV